MTLGTVSKSKDAIHNSHVRDNNYVLRPSIPWPAGLDVKYITILHTDQLSENRTDDEMGMRFNCRYGADGEE